VLRTARPCATSSCRPAPRLPPAPTRVQNPRYLRVARAIQSTLAQHNRVRCGYTQVRNVDTGAAGGRAHAARCSAAAQATPQLAVRSETRCTLSPRASAQVRSLLSCILGLPGEHGDLMESYFLSETVKYLYLLFSRAPHLVDYYVLTTEV
jgi:hypothetical protein